MAKNRNDYFKYLEEQMAYAVEAAELLQSIITNYTTIDLVTAKNEMHEIEHQADELHHTILNKLSSEFITVIDQEDILRLVQLIDDITDALDEVVMDFYMYHITETLANAPSLVSIVNKCVKALYASICELRNYKKSEKLNALLKEVAEIESEADEIYVKAIYDLFASNYEYKKLISHKAIYESLENCCDLCKYSVEVIKQIVIKNS